MIKTITIIAVLFLGVAFNSYAHESDRIAQLENEVQELKLRISNLELLLNNSSKSQEVVLSNEGWKSIRNWRKLTTDMGYNEVQEILGEPYKVDGGNVATWYYRNDGTVTFMRGKAFQWREPR